ncbi:gamma hydroxybutyrate dehydrogenase [Fusarium heterosporum]|uniref:Gamma hydroxybutyrate dehydrogenase n=1 Tax=Fusarium heterosporum TaxID=42747 RepID=A0A8H5TYA8_FUSHE|nr:gamma hydroxybutyrate dehydrogenase [Fusarium heterosporum]
MSALQIGWIGLGSMGLAMAINLQRHLSSTNGSSLIYFNRTITRGDPLKDIGAQPAITAKDLVTKSDIVFLSLSDDSALESTLDAITDADDSRHLAGKIIIDTSTVHPDSSAKAQARLNERGAEFIASPVFGASPVAAQGKLLWIVAGPDAAVEKISPYIEGVMGRGVIRVGEDVRLSSKMKTAGNFITAGMMEVVAEAHVLAEKSGLGSKNLEALIEQQYGPLALSMSQRLTTGAYIPARGDRPWSDLNLAIKDVGHGIALAEQSGARLEVAEVALKHLTDAKQFSETEGRPLDSSSMYGILRKEADLSFETDLVKERDAKKDTQ